MSKNTTLSLEKEMIVWHVKDGIHNNKRNIATPVVKWCPRNHAHVSPTDTIDIITLLPHKWKNFRKN